MANIHILDWMKFVIRAVILSELIIIDSFKKYTVLEENFVLKLHSDFRHLLK